MRNKFLPFKPPSLKYLVLTVGNGQKKKRTINMHEKDNVAKTKKVSPF